MVFMWTLTPPKVCIPNIPSIQTWESTVKVVDDNSAKVWMRGSPSIVLNVD